ncbi:GNAT family N-acetyltransferase [Amycolatopsis antarctica]|uniref:GNAT family N-acetyltransferase n=1 Tax=Amycolatopsis antarctica TaxID=1854586 RepID=A0A263DAD1_9PSEU|nr:GNAT family N-acetyltransferase [Amycolatopsis antarctica]
MAADVRICDPRTDPEPDDWVDFARAVRPHAVWNHALLGIEAWMSRNPPLLATVHQGGRIVAAFTVLVCRPRRVPRYAPDSRSARGPVWAEVYQPWLSGFPGILHRPEVAGGPLREAVRAVERELVRALGRGLLGVFYRGVGPGLLPAVEGGGRISRQTDSAAVLENHFEGTEDWLAALSKSRRGGLRRQQRALAGDSSLVVRGGAGRTDLDAAVVARLINAHRARFPAPPLDTRSPVAASYVDALVRHPAVHTLTYHDDGGRLLALNTMLDHPVTPVKQHWAALSRADGGRPNLYFDAYVRAVRWATAHGRPRVSAGRGKLDVKASLGFAPSPVHGVLVPRPVLGR